MGGYKGLLRYTGYVVFVVCILYGLQLFAGNLPGGLYLSVAADADSRLTTSEYSLVEMLQNILIAFCVLVFVWIATRDRLRRRRVLRVLLGQLGMPPRGRRLLKT